MLHEVSLALGPQLGCGDQGSVWEVRNVNWENAPESVGVRGLVYKRYRPTALRSVDAGVLRSMPLFLETLSEQDRLQLLRWVAWPLEIIWRDGSLSGFVMPRAPSAFFFNHRLTSGALKRETAKAQLLLNSAEYLQRSGIGVSASQRCGILADLAAGLAFLHKRGVVVGDISPINVLWSANPACRVFLTDADSMVIGDQYVTPRVETIDWSVAVPPGESVGRIPRQADDVYKLGLMVLRALTGSQTSRNPDTLTDSLPDVKASVKASLSADPAERPTAAEWERLLTLAASADIKLPWLEAPSALNRFKRFKKRGLRR